MRVILASAVALLGACSNDPYPTGMDMPPDNSPPALPDVGFHLPMASLSGFSYTISLETGVDYANVIVDTGSSTTGVASAKCTNCKVTGGYTPGTTATDKHVTACTTYADGSSWAGEVFTDQSWLRGPFVSLDFVEITSQQNFFDPMSLYQGIIGLGPKELLETGTSSYMDGLAKAYPGMESMAFRLCPFSGDMWLDGYDPMAAAADVKYTPMLPINAMTNPFYSVALNDLKLGGVTTGQTSASFGPMLVDTGTSFTYIPTPALNALLAKINSDAAFKAMFPAQTLADTMTGDCVTTAGVTSEMVDAMLPKFGLVFPDGAGGTFTVELPASQSYLTPAGMGQFCLGVSSSGPDATGGSLLGDTVLTGLLTVFDITNGQMGFAPQAGCVPFDPPASMNRAHKQSPYVRLPPVRPAAR